MEDEFDILVGIDWAKEDHQVCVLDRRRKVLDERSVKHSGSALTDLADRLAKHGDPGRTAVAIETPRGAVVEMLLERGFVVFHLNPKQLDRFRDRHTVAGAKDDRRDAFVLADSLRTDVHLFRRVRPDADNIVVLRELVRTDDDINKTMNGLTNRVREQLLRYFPQMLQVSPTADEPWFWKLLVMVPTPEAANKTPRGRVATLLKEHRIRRISADEILEILQQPPLRVSKGATIAASTHIAMLVQQLLLLHSQQRHVESSAKRLLDEMSEAPAPEGQQVEHHDVTILRSLPGVGWKVSATVLVEAAQALADRDYPALRALAGVAPVTLQTGKNKRGRAEMRRAANNRLRNAHYHWARVSAQTDPATRAYYAELRSRGHSHGRALRSVADRNLRILVAMLRSGTLYDVTKGRRAEVGP